MAVFHCAYQYASFGAVDLTQIPASFPVSPTAACAAPHRRLSAIPSNILLGKRLLTVQQISKETYQHALHNDTVLAHGGSQQVVDALLVIFFASVMDSRPSLRHDDAICSDDRVEAAFQELEDAPDLDSMIYFVEATVAYWIQRDEGDFLLVLALSSAVGQISSLPWSDTHVEVSKTFIKHQSQMLEKKVSEPEGSHLRLEHGRTTPKRKMQELETKCGGLKDTSDRNKVKIQCTERALWAEQRKVEEEAQQPAAAQHVIAHVSKKHTELQTKFQQLLGCHVCRDDDANMAFGCGYRVCEGCHRAMRRLSKEGTKGMQCHIFRRPILDKIRPYFE